MSVPLERVSALTFGMLFLGIGLVGCTSREVLCQQPVLRVSPTQVRPGDRLTVWWVGGVSCEGEQVLSGGTGWLALADAAGYPNTEPFIPPDAAVDDWVVMDLRAPAVPYISGGTLAVPSPSVVGVIPRDLPAGQYVVYVVGDFLISSGSFTVGP